MARKIKVVDVDAPTEQVETVETTNQTETVEAVEATNQPEPVETLQPVEEKKTKAKRAPRAKKTIDTSLLDVGVNMSDEPPVVEEPKPIINAVEEPPVSKNIKTVELVECPKCNKKLTERTLKYSHEAVCPANEAKTIKKPKKEQAAPKQVQYEETLDEHIERPAIQKIKRIQVRSERYKNLITHAF